VSASRSAIPLNPSASIGPPGIISSIGPEPRTSQYSEAPGTCNRNRAGVAGAVHGQHLARTRLRPRLVPVTHITMQIACQPWCTQIAANGTAVPAVGKLPDRDCQRGEARSVG
jgi:hypothetical protein